MADGSADHQCDKFRVISDELPFGAQIYKSTGDVPHRVFEDVRKTFFEFETLFHGGMAPLILRTLSLTTLVAFPHLKAIHRTYHHLFSCAFFMQRERHDLICVELVAHL